MKVLLVGFILGLLVALIGAKALGETNGAVGSDDPRFHHHRRSAQQGANENKGTGNANAEAIDLLRRLTRQAALNNKDTPSGNKAACKYRKGSWSACDATTKVRTRTLTLKKGDANICESTKTLQKQCKGGKKGGKQRNNGKNRPNKNRNGENNNNNRPAGNRANKNKTPAV